MSSTSLCELLGAPNAHPAMPHPPWKETVSVIDIEQDLLDAKMEMLATQQQRLQDELHAELQKQKDRISELERHMNQLQCLGFLKVEDTMEQNETEEDTMEQNETEERQENGLDVHLQKRHPADSFALSQTIQTARKKSFTLRSIKTQMAKLVDRSVHRSVSALEREHLEYRWAGSMWDSSLFVGTSMLSPSASLAVGICHFVYIVVCIGIITQTDKSLTIPKYDLEGVRQLNIWRFTVAHDVALRNSVTQEPLARSVCSEKVSVPYSNLQTSMVMELNEYLDPREIVGVEFTAGSMLAILVVSVWYLTLGTELRSVMDFLSGCIGLSIGKQDVLEPGGPDNSMVRLVELSYFRAGYWFTTVLLRISIVSLLAYYGTLFLVCESDLRDMIMNAVALELILNLDELIFQALLPKSQQGLLESVLPLKYPAHGKRCRHWNAWGQLLVILCVIGISMAVVVINVLNPFVDVLGKNLDALCGGVDGSLDFVVAVDALGIPWAAVAQTESESMTYAMQAVLDVQKYGLQEFGTDLFPNQRNNSGGFMQVATPDILHSRSIYLSEFKSPVDWELVDTTDIAFVVGHAELNILSHEDFGDLQGSVYNKLLRFLLGRTGSVTCADVPLAFCYEYGSSRDNVVFRKLCPAWCGCDSPEKGTVSNPYANSQLRGYIGCSSFNTKRTNFVGKLRELPCNDTTSLDVFETWVQGVGNAVAFGGGLMIDALMSDFNKGGCDEVHKAVLEAGAVSQINLCSETSLAAICPTSCGCSLESGWTPYHATAFDFCPFSCHFAVRHVTTIAVNHSGETGTSGPFVNMPCMFPFKYQGEEHDACTCEDWTNPWCAITLASDGSSFHWGDCPGSC